MYGMSFGALLVEAVLIIMSGLLRLLKFKKHFLAEIVTVIETFTYGFWYTFVSKKCQSPLYSHLSTTCYSLVNHL